VAEWSKATDCKSVEIFYVGSNPTDLKRGAWLNGRATALQAVGYGFKSHCFQKCQKENLKMMV